MEQENADDLLSIQQARDLTGCPKTSLRHWCKTGKLKAEKVGRDWVVRRGDLVEFVDGDDSISSKHIKRFEYLIDQLNKLMDEIREDCPEANYYLANDSMNLMKGESHDRDADFPLRENSVTSKRLRHSGGGDW